MPKRGDVILTREAPLGEVGMIRTDKTIFLGQRLVAYRANPNKLDARYLLYAMQQSDLQGQIKSLGSGATVEHMRVPDAKRLTLMLPPLPVQHRIASILSTYDDLIENNTRRIAILEEMARRIYTEWFVHFRFPGHERVKMVDSELGLIPNGWEVANYTDIADVLSGGTPKKSVEQFWNGDIPFYTPKDTPDGCYVLTTDAYITEDGLAKCNSKLYSKDTVFITARGTVGKVFFAGRDMAMNQSCYALRAREGLKQAFIFLSIKEAVEELKTKSHGAVFSTIIVDTFRQLKVARPPYHLIDQLADTVAPIFDLVFNLQHKIANLRQTRDLLLPKLISGEIDVSETEIAA